MASWDKYVISADDMDFLLNTVLNIKNEGLSSESLDKYLYATTKSKDKVECRLFLDVIVL